MNKQQDIQVVVQCAIQNDTRCQRKLVDLFSDYLYAIAIRYMGNREDARDQLQIAWIKIFDNLSSFDIEKGEFKSWISKILINTCLSTYRKNNKHWEDLKDYNLTFLPGEDIIMDQLEAKEILELVSKLPESYRQVFNMAIIDGYKHKEIAEAIGITEILSRTRLKRAKNMLRIQFEKLTKFVTWEKID